MFVNSVLVHVFTVFLLLIMPGISCPNRNEKRYDPLDTPSVIGVSTASLRSMTVSSVGSTPPSQRKSRAFTVGAQSKGASNVHARVR